MAKQSRAQRPEDLIGVIDEEILTPEEIRYTSPDRWNRSTREAQVRRLSNEYTVEELEEMFEMLGKMADMSVIQSSGSIEEIRSRMGVVREALDRRRSRLAVYAT